LTPLASEPRAVLGNHGKSKFAADPPLDPGGNSVQMLSKQ